MMFLKKLFLFVSAFIFRLLGLLLSAGKSGDIKKIVIIQQAKLGDMICTTPMFRAVKEKYPQAKVIVVGSKINKEVLAGSPFVDEYIVFNGVLNTASVVRSKKVDFGCVAAPDFIGLAVLCLGLVPRIVGPRVVGRKSPYETFFYRALRFFVKTAPHDFFGYAPREYLRLLESIGIFSEDSTKSLVYSDEASSYVDKYLSSCGIGDGDLLIAISPSAGNKIKNWGGDNFAKLALSLAGRSKIKVFIIAGPRDEMEVKEMLSFMNGLEGKVFNTLGLLSVDQLKCFISRMNLFISVDTGPIYIAEAFGVPTVDIVGPVDERVQPPRGKFNKVVVPEREEAQLFIMDTRSYDYKEAFRQARASSVDEVLVVVDDLLDSL